MCVLQGEAALKFAANALGVPAADLTSALCTKLLHVGGNTVVQQQSVEQARDKRDALAKVHTYAMLVGPFSKGLLS